MNTWQVALIAAATTIVVIFLLGAVAMLVHGGFGYGEQRFGASLMRAHRMRGAAFAGQGHRMCTHLDEASVDASSEAATLWIDRRLDLDDAQREYLSPIVDATRELARELQPMCGAPHGDAKATVALAADAAEAANRALQRIDERFAAFYDALDESQRREVDALVVHHHPSVQ